MNPGTNVAMTALCCALLAVACAEKRDLPTSAEKESIPTRTISAIDVTTLTDPPCVFSSVGTTMTLTADCTTYMTIPILDGFTLDGAGHTITAMDPPSYPADHFRGAVVKNANPGATVHVVNLTVSASGLHDVCDGSGPPDDRLRGILLDEASGSITTSAAVHINQGASGCQEGNGIEVRNFGSTGTKMVLVDHNMVLDYQKGGIVANGDVVATVTANTVQGVGPVPYIAQNGIQLGFGATGEVSGNSISDNFYTGCSHKAAAKTDCIPYVAAGLLLYDIDASMIRRSNNRFSNNQFNVLLVTYQSLDS